MVLTAAQRCASAVEGHELELHAVWVAERHQREREALHGVHAGVWYALALQVRPPGVQCVDRLDLEGQVVQAGPRRVEAVPLVRRVVIDSQAERPVGRTEHDRVTVRLAAVVAYLKEAAEPEHPLVPGSARLDVGDRDADVMDPGERRTHRGLGGRRRFGGGHVVLLTVDQASGVGAAAPSAAKIDAKAAWSGGTNGGRAGTDAMTSTSCLAIWPDALGRWELKMAVGCSRATSLAAARKRSWSTSCVHGESNAAQPAIPSTRSASETSSQLSGTLGRIAPNVSTVYIAPVRSSSRPVVIGLSNSGGRTPRR